MKSSLKILFAYINVKDENVAMNYYNIFNEKYL